MRGRKMVLLFSVAILFASCMYNIDNTEPMVVRSIDAYGKNICIYSFRHKETIGYGFSRLLDSCGKYNIGDTVTISKR